MTEQVYNTRRVVAVASIFAAHLVCYVCFAAVGRIPPLEFFNLLLLAANAIIGIMVARGRGNILLGCGVMAIIGAHAFMGHRIAPDSLTSGAILMVNVIVLYVGFKINRHLPSRYWYAFLVSYFLLFGIFIVAMENAEALFLLFLLGLAASARSLKLLGYFWAVTLSFTFFQPYAWEATIILVFILTGLYSARGNVRSPVAVVFLACGLALVFLVLLPVIVVAMGEDPHNIVKILREARVRRAIGTTFLTATVSTAFLVIFTVPLAYAVSRLRFRGRTLLLSLIDIPIVVPQSVAGIALVAVFGSRQFLGETILRLFGIRFDGTLLGICLAQVFVAMPFIAKSAIAAFDGVPERLEVTARTLGASSWGAFRRVALPLASRGIFLGAVLAWARAAGEFGALVFIAPTPETAPVAAFNRFNSVGLIETGPLVATLLLFSMAMFFILQFASRAMPSLHGGKGETVGAPA